MSAEDDGGEDAGFAGLAKVFGWVGDVITWWNKLRDRLS